MPVLELVIVTNRSLFIVLVYTGTRKGYEDMKEIGTATSQREREREIHTHEGLLISVQCLIYHAISLTFRHHHYHRKQKFNSYVSHLQQQTTGRNLLNFVTSTTSVVHRGANSQGTEVESLLAFYSCGHRSDQQSGDFSTCNCHPKSSKILIKTSKILPL
jgi:hypothetical protein